jgi:hypothetical protein
MSSVRVLHERKFVVRYGWGDFVSVYRVYSVSTDSVLMRIYEV